MYNIVGDVPVAAMKIGLATAVAGPVAGAWVGGAEFIGVLSKVCSRLGAADSTASKIARVAYYFFGLIGCAGVICTYVFYPLTIPVYFGVGILSDCFKIQERVSRVVERCFLQQPRVDEIEEVVVEEEVVVNQKEKTLEGINKIKNINIKQFLINKQHYKPIESEISLRSKKKYNTVEEIEKLFDSTKGRIKTFNDDGEERTREAVKQKLNNKFYAWMTKENVVVFNLLIERLKKPNSENEVDSFIRELGAAAFHCSARISTLLSDFYILYVRPGQFGKAFKANAVNKLHLFLEIRRKELLDSAATFKCDDHPAATHAYARRVIGPQFGVRDILPNSEYDGYSHIKKKDLEGDVQAKFISSYTPEAILQMLKEELDKGMTSLVHKGSGSLFPFALLQKWFEARGLENADFTNFDDEGNVTYKDEALVYFLVEAGVLTPPPISQEK